MHLVHNSMQADVWGQLEGVLQYVELLDLPWLPCMDSPCYLKGPGVSLLSRTGFQEVLSGSSGLQFNEERPVFILQAGAGDGAAIKDDPPLGRGYSPATL